MVLISTYISFEVEFRRLGTFRAQIKFRLFFRSSDWPEVIICMNQKKMFEPLFPLDRYKDSLKPFTISSTRFFVKPSTSATFYFQKSLLIEKCPSSKTCIRHQSLKRITQQGKICCLFIHTAKDSKAGKRAIGKPVEESVSAAKNNIYFS